LKLLVDTHCWLWQFADPTRLRADVVDMLCEPENKVYLSAASRLAAQGIELLPIDLRHVLRLVGLPMVHRDPFDRLLVAQAKAEGMAIITADRLVAAYDVQIIWASA
jgi:PIN domain nuclease of toxin-antitoxin system